MDRVIGQGNRMTVEHLKELRYINAVLRETIRLCPTVPQFTRSIRRDNSNDFEYLAGGQYAVSRNDKILCLVSKSQRDPKVYGEDANEFRPERMLDENFLRLPKAAWKPVSARHSTLISDGEMWLFGRIVVLTSPLPVYSSEPVSELASDVNLPGKRLRCA